MKRRPIAVSEDSLDFEVINVIPEIITAAPTAAPRIPGKPNKMAKAMPGNTPWARASPIKARPRRITKVPAIAQAMETRTPAIRASTMKALKAKGVINQSKDATLLLQCD
jgi:hypothetical protein